MFYCFDEMIVKNETQVLDAIENYFNDLYTSATSVTQEEYDSFTDSGIAPA